jgi:hypothetical protein
MPSDNNHQDAHEDELQRACGVYDDLDEGEPLILCQYCSQQIESGHTCGICMHGFPPQNCRCANNSDYCGPCQEWLDNRREQVAALITTERIVAHSERWHVKHGPDIVEMILLAAVVMEIIWLMAAFQGGR